MTGRSQRGALLNPLTSSRERSNYSLCPPDCPHHKKIPLYQRLFWECLLSHQVWRDWPGTDHPKEPDSQCQHPPGSLVHSPWWWEQIWNESHFTLYTHTLYTIQIVRIQSCVPPPPDWGRTSWSMTVRERMNMKYTRIVTSKLLLEHSLPVYL